jgi:hypothetical protein
LVRANDFKEIVHREVPVPDALCIDGFWTDCLQDRQEIIQVDIFRRISHGATRLQEVLADRVAAQLYGAQAFEGGLRHVIRQDIDFAMRSKREINQAIDARQPVRNLYDVGPTESASVEGEFAKALNRPTTEDDTHPAPCDRFRLVAKVASPKRVPSPGVVWDLFKDREAVVRDMMAMVEKKISAYRK